MKIVLDLSDDVTRLIEYLPQELLPSILQDIIKDAILSKSTYKADSMARMQSSSEIKELISLVQNLAVTGRTANVPTSASIVKEDKPKVDTKVSIVADDIDFGDLADDDDLMSMLK